MPLHIFYSPDNISSTSMIRASVSSLVVSSGSRWLWVHAVLIWWVTITWTATVLWITWGALAYRRREIKRLAKRVEESRETKRRLALGEDGLGRGGADDADKWTVGDERDGIKRCRTLMVTNVPPDSELQSFKACWTISEDQCGTKRCCRTTSTTTSTDIKYDVGKSHLKRLCQSSRLTRTIRSSSGSL